MTTAEMQSVEPTVRFAIGEGLELIRQLVAERGRCQDLDGQMDDARADGFTYDAPCPDD